MPVLVDGNNLMFAARALHESGSALGRSMLCRILGEWSHRTGKRVHVVFDGPTPPPAQAAQLGGKLLTLTFGGSLSADEVIAELVRRDSAARRLLVVSSDRQVQRAARRRRAHFLRSDAFWVGMIRDLERPAPTRVEPPQKRVGLAEGESGDWLEYFGLS